MIWPLMAQESAIALHLLSPLAQYYHGLVRYRAQGSYIVRLWGLLRVFAYSTLTLRTSWYDASQRPDRARPCLSRALVRKESRLFCDDASKISDLISLSSNHDRPVMTNVPALDLSRQVLRLDRNSGSE